MAETTTLDRATVRAALAELIRGRADVAMTHGWQELARSWTHYRVAFDVAGILEYELEDATIDAEAVLRRAGDVIVEASRRAREILDQETYAGTARDRLHELAEEVARG